MGTKHEALYVVDVTTVLRPLTCSSPLTTTSPLTSSRPSAAADRARTTSAGPTAAAATVAAAAAAAAAASSTVASGAASAGAPPLTSPLAAPLAAPLTTHLLREAGPALDHVPTVESVVLAEPPQEGPGGAGGEGAGGEGADEEPLAGWAEAEEPDEARTDEEATAAATVVEEVAVVVEEAEAEEATPQLGEEQVHSDRFLVSEAMGAGQSRALALEQRFASRGVAPYAAVAAHLLHDGARAPALGPRAGGGVAAPLPLQTERTGLPVLLLAHFELAPGRVLRLSAAGRG
jgi:hypothetical protein